MRPPCASETVALDRIANVPSNAVVHLKNLETNILDPLTLVIVGKQ